MLGEPGATNDAGTVKDVEEDLLLKTKGSADIVMITEGSNMIFLRLLMKVINNSKSFCLDSDD